ncbi:mRNA interferase RelE/StbE [Hydrogenivirga caldilitoris]|uniref:mRNA interferase RelE/StbE n=1 Tax=Hydrogenivirga caldilitoris TaxID=246264 RepID=A0A497XTJ7_9AQUI|nr:type II toxin-antitoxin system RelE/ParE family toxin [Hydrogenivirga caldilitoris]RLJ70462.1 mRNA interferase RelE/StbE [Hydrogenivirga caldilitoris]
MSWTIKFSSTTEKKYRKLDRNTKKRIKNSLEELGESDDLSVHRHVKPLVGKLKGFYWLRVGDFRVIFTLIPEERIIAVVNMAPKGEAYKL